ncbi:MAG: DUF2892 domain-containing protein [Bacteroidetes bacterium]|uniref:DUF2892 domain-containing protein n=1 Tax=Phaeocystidibacter marisrubri TaxID=1577780 RepID=A0A6L3ZC84_9FLAO|nr:DUF2892 domain-containing protein [Phaeocystidibacter marisrubri]KAB2815252.1 DUF2892 domain-containing protein [Phaeocystidibacter marisrubri]TNE27279.1 MAG: DUF2892 domain-containing protein [Bacteroidota bacterium]GGH71126.1 membrane protein [Phaeocystidibacter marisrubri]
MKSNMSNIDRLIRLIAAVAMAYAVFTNAVTGTLSIVFLILAAVFALTALVKFCPLYLPFGIHTNKRKKAA